MERSAVFSLRMVLHFPDLCSACMGESENLLQAIGKYAVWPADIVQALHTAISAGKAADRGEDLPAADAVGELNLASLLKGREAWDCYEHTISKWHAKRPKVIVSALQDSLDTLLGACGREEVNEVNAVIKTRSEQLIALLGGQVGDQQSIDPGLGTCSGKRIQTICEYRVVVSHEQQWRRNTALAQPTDGVECQLRRRDPHEHSPRDSNGPHCEHCL